MPEVTDKMKLLSNFAAQLAEHFSSVQIICTDSNDGHTDSLTAGTGNFYARMGSVGEWLRRVEELDRADARAEYRSNNRSK